MRTLRLALWLLCGLIAASGTAGAQDAADMPLHLADQELRLSQFDLVTLDSLPVEPNGHFEFEVPLDGQPTRAVLRKRSIRGDGFRVLSESAAGGQIDHPSGPVRTFRGTTANDAESIVAGSLLRTGMEAVIALGDGRVFNIEPHFESFLRGDRTQFIVYEGSDFAFVGPCCEPGQPVPVPRETEPTAHFLGTSGCGSNLCVADLCFDLDKAFYQHYGSSLDNSRDQAEALLNVANIPFRRDVNLEHRIVLIFIRAFSEPSNYTTQTSASGMLGALRNQWINFHGLVARDVVHMLTARVSGGAAYIGGICSSSTGYSVTSINPLPSVLSPSLAYVANQMAHQLGHNWNADHCTCGGTTADHTMNANGATVVFPLRFHPIDTIPEIEAFRNTRTCLVGERANDDISGAFVVCGGSYVFNNNNSTTDGTASCAGSQNDLWFVYTPANTGLVSFTTCSLSSTAFDTVLSIHDGGIGDVSDQIACGDNGCFLGWPGSSLNTSVVAGQPYWIRVAGNGSQTGNFALNVGDLGCETPINDDWQDALAVGPGRYFGSTDSATRDGSNGCDNGGASGDVWYAYTAIGSGYLTADLCESSTSWFSSVSIHDASHPLPNTSAAVLACNANICGFKGQVSIPVSAGQSVLIRIAGFGDESGGYNLGLTGPEPLNDTCAGATAIQDGTTIGDLQGYFPSDASVSCSSLSDSLPDAWYRYTAQADGLLEVTTCGTNDDPGVDLGMETALAVYWGCPGTPGQELGCAASGSSICSGDAGLVRDAALGVPVTQGQTVFIRVSRATTERPAGRFLLNVMNRPANDTCAFAAPIEAWITLGSLAGASASGPVSCVSGGSALPDVWFTYDVPTDGILYLSTCGTNDMGGVDQGMDTILEVYDSCASGTGAPIFCSDNSGNCVSSLDMGQVRDSWVTLFGVQAGQQYWVRLIAKDPNGPTNFSLTRRLVPTNNGCGGALPVTNGTNVGYIAGGLAMGASSCISVAPNAWYTYTAPCSGQVTLSTCGTSDLGGIDQGIDTAISVHTGCAGSVSNEVACSTSNAGDCGGADQGAQVDAYTTFFAFAGTTYWIRIAEQGSQAVENDGEFLLNISCQDGPISYCSGAGLPCPCGNAAPDGRGCGNSTGTGAWLTANGSGSLSSSLSLVVWGIPSNQFMIFFSGLNDPLFAFGDGIRCVGSDVLRSPTFLVSSPPFGIGDALGAFGLSAGTSDIGSTRFIQSWFRDPTGPCGNAFNLSNGIAIVVEP